jgi:hypothetical protein
MGIGGQREGSLGVVVVGEMMVRLSVVRFSRSARMSSQRDSGRREVHFRWRNFDLRMATPSHRQGKGFKRTFAAELIWGNVKLAKFKLDWFFVKAGIDMLRDTKGPHLFAPHFARTLVNLNNGPAQPIVDHSPMRVDLPYSEPSQLPDKVKAP